MAWISGNRYLSQSEKDNNVLQEIYPHFHDLGYSNNAIAAICANMDSESTINPGIWESLHSGDTDYGFGLCQWTPATKLINWLAARGISDWQNGTNQLTFFDSGDDGYGGSQWGNSGDPNAPSTRPPLTWDEFKTSDLDVRTLAAYFMYYWEKPSYNPEVNHLSQRQAQAEYYLELIGGAPPIEPEVTSVTISPSERQGERGKFYTFIATVTGNLALTDFGVDTTISPSLPFTAGSATASGQTFINVTVPKKARSRKYTITVRSSFDSSMFATAVLLLGKLKGSYIYYLKRRDF